MEPKQPDLGYLCATATEYADTGRYLLLWVLGVPIPILLLIWIMGGIH